MSLSFLSAPFATLRLCVEKEEAAMAAIAPSPAERHGERSLQRTPTALQRGLEGRQRLVVVRLVDDFRHGLGIDDLAVLVQDHDAAC